MTGGAFKMPGKPTKSNNDKTKTKQKPKSKPKK
jgi:hypothetical protein